MKSIVLICLFMSLGTPSLAFAQRNSENREPIFMTGQNVFDLIFYGLASRTDRVSAIIPSDLKPVTVNRESIISIAFLDYKESSIGPYQEMIVQFLVDTEEYNYPSLNSALSDHSSSSRGYYQHQLIIDGPHAKTNYLAVEGGLRAGFPKVYGEIEKSYVQGRYSVVARAEDFELSGVDRKGGRRDVLQTIGAIWRINPLVRIIQDQIFPRHFETLIYTQLAGVTLSFDTTKDYFEFPNISIIQEGEIEPTSKDSQGLFRELEVNFSGGIRATGLNSLSLDMNSISRKSLQALKEKGLKNPALGFEEALRTGQFPSIFNDKRLKESTGRSTCEKSFI